MCLHLPAPVLECLRWWHAILSTPCTTRSLTPRPTADPDIWVDVSMNWGIDVVIGTQWAAWKLKKGWNGGGRDIGWAESIALELAVLMLVHCGFRDCLITIRGDNTGVIGAFSKGRSRSTPRNDSLRRIASSVIPNNISILPVYVTSAANRADPVSRGILGSSILRAARPPVLPPELTQYLEDV